MAQVCFILQHFLCFYLLKYPRGQQPAVYKNHFLQPAELSFIKNQSYKGILKTIVSFSFPEALTFCTIYIHSVT